MEEVGGGRWGEEEGIRGGGERVGGGGGEGRREGRKGVIPYSASILQRLCMGKETAKWKKKDFHNTQKFIMLQFSRIS